MFFTPSSFSSYRQEMSCSIPCPGWWQTQGNISTKSLFSSLLLLGQDWMPREKTMTIVKTCGTSDG